MAQSDAPCYTLTIICRRKRLLDQSNLCVKFVEDALKGTIIADDSPRHLRTLNIRQEKIAKGESPETIIELEVDEW